MRHSRQLFLIFPVILLLIAWSTLSRPVPTQAESLNSIQNQQGQTFSGHLLVATETATSTPIPLEFTAQELAEGRPTGIIVGALALVVLIFLGTFLTLNRPVSKK